MSGKLFVNRPEEWPEMMCRAASEIDISPDLMIWVVMNCVMSGGARSLLRETSSSDDDEG